MTEMTPKINDLNITASVMINISKFVWLHLPQKVKMQFLVKALKSKTEKMGTENLPSKYNMHARIRSATS